MSLPFTDDPEPTIRSGPVRLRFRCVEDHWTHLLEYDHESNWQLVAEPLRGDSDLSRVASPTYQEVHRQSDEEGDQILAIGRWGKHHFSAVFSLTRRENATILSVDVADRCRQPFEAFGCTYRVMLGPGHLVDASPESASWNGPAGILRLEAEPPDRLAVAELGRVGTSVQIQAAIAPESFTQRCRYRWVFTPNSIESIREQSISMTAPELS